MPLIQTPEKWGLVPTIRDGLDRRFFRNLQFVGTVPSRTRMQVGGLTKRRVKIHLPSYSPAFDYLLKLAGDNFHIVNPNVEMIENVMRSWDDRPPYLKTVPHYKEALAFFDHFYAKQLFPNSTAHDDLIYDFIDMSKSPGYPGSFFHLKTKREAYCDPGFIKHKQDMQESGYNRPAFHKVTPKVEFLPTENIDAGKCRLFVIPELLLLELQIKFGKLTSLSLKEFGWSAYGFNPYNGGADKLAKRLLTKRIRFFYDVSGWDKFLNILRDIYEKQRKYNGYRNMSPREQQEFDWMVENTINMFCVFYDGSVYKKDYGNGSGSGTTTRDNILAHILIMATILYTAFYEKYGKYPNPTFVASQVINLFGDDSINSVDEEFDKVLEEGFVARIFSHFGMKLKFFYGGKDFPLEKMEFLGFTFSSNSFGFLPLYDVKRLATSMVYKGSNSNSREAMLSKTFILTLMSFPSAEHQFFKQHATHVASLYQHASDLTETEMTMITLIQSINDSMCLSIFLGLESSSPDVFKFFSSGMEEEGIKELFPSCQANL